MKRAADLRLVALLAAACALICALVPDGATIVRTLPAALLVLVLPGYALTAAVLAPTQITRLERLVLAIALSMVAGVITAVLLNAVWHLETTPWALALAVVTLIAALAGARRGHGQPVPRPRVPRIGVAATLALTGAVLLAGGAAALGVTTLHAPRGTQGTTALWISPRGDNDVAVGVHSVERGDRHYELDVRVAGQRGRLIGPFALAPGEERRLLLPAPTGPLGKPIVNVILHRLDGLHPAVRHVALRAGRRTVIFRGPPPVRPCPRAHPLRSQNGCYRVALRGRKRLRRYVSGRTVVLP
jgi:Protein of unknown function (DUF1616)